MNKILDSQYADENADDLIFNYRDITGPSGKDILELS